MQHLRAGSSCVVYCSSRWQYKRGPRCRARCAWWHTRDRATTSTSACRRPLWLLACHLRRSAPDRLHMQESLHLCSGPRIFSCHSSYCHEDLGTPSSRLLSSGWSLEGYADHRLALRLCPGFDLGIMTGSSVCAWCRIASAACGGHFICGMPMEPLHRPVPCCLLISFHAW